MSFFALYAGNSERGKGNVVHFSIVTSCERNVDTEQSAPWLKWRLGCVRRWRGDFDLLFREAKAATGCGRRVARYRFLLSCGPK